MTAVANPPSFQQNSRSVWGASVGQAGLDMNADEVARMFAPRKSAQRANSSSSISSTSSTSSTATTIQAAPPQTNGVPMAASGDLSSWGTAAAAGRKKTQNRAWPSIKSEAISGVSTARPQSILTTNGPSAASSISTLQPAPIVLSQHILQNPIQTNGTRPTGQAEGEGNPVLYLLSMNGTFERKTIAVPFYPDSLRIGRQTNAKTVPTPANGFFDSKVLSRQHAEIWADRNGKVWIRDVKSSNGTFVNGARLSAENRDSEPHELQTQDHLELGIDIVNEDQKTVVHHKVAAKVEHAGFLGATNNVLDMNFGDLDPANGAMMVPSQPMQMRGRPGSQGSVGSNGRLGPPTSAAGSQMSIMGQQRPMNFWLTPVTTEQIVKKLTHEIKTARLQTNELGRADHFFGAFLSKEDVRESENPPVVEPIKAPQVNGGSLAFRGDAKPRFSDPPAPPPQQPLPEKPDVARPHNFDPSSPSSLKRTNTERPRSVPNSSPIRQEPASQIVALVEALTSAKKEIDTQSARMRDLEDMLQKERQARELAEEFAKRLESQSAMQTNGASEQKDQEFVLEEAFEPPYDPVQNKELEGVESEQKPEDIETKTISESTLLEQRLETTLADMQELRDQMQSFKFRAETAEAERDSDRKTLAEMVEKIRSDELARKSSSTERGRSPPHHLVTKGLLDSTADGLNATVAPLLRKAGLANGHAENGGSERPAVGTLSRAPGGQDLLLYHTTPYASMIGVVLIGVGLMAYLNGWQPPKADR